MIGEESHLPYDRPPLSKQVLSGRWPIEQTLLATRERLERAAVDLRLGDPAVALDPETMTVTLASGTVVRASHVVIATGARARRLPYGEGLIHYLRNLDDVVGLRRALEGRTEPRVVIIGGGFIGAEAATSLHATGAQVTVLEASPRPLVQVLGETVSAWLEGLPEAAGVTLLVNQRVLGVEPVANAVSITVEGQAPLLADVVMAGVGALPNDEWVASSGIAMNNGIIVDGVGQSSSTIAAIGDVARFPLAGPLGTDQVRIEHWEVASDQAARLAHAWVDGQAPTKPLIPYFWSDQYGKKIQMLGHPHPDDHVSLVRGSVDEGKWVALYHRHDVVTGVIGLSQPRAITLARELLDQPTTLGDAWNRAPWAG